jgi:hypothetical protein
VLSNLVASNISNPSIYDFADPQKEGTAQSSDRKCKLMPGDAEWPSDASWREFNSTLGGTLIKGVPSAAVCYPDWPEYDQAKCTEVTENWIDPIWQ